MVKSRLKEIVDNSGLKQTFIAEKTNTSKTTLSAIVNGQIPRLETALVLAKFFNKKVEDIWYLGDEE